MKSSTVKSIVVGACIDLHIYCLEDFPCHGDPANIMSLYALDTKKEGLEKRRKERKKMNKKFQHSS
jgi:hypothetical protein